jgi:hypothetical protein
MNKEVISSPDNRKELEKNAVLLLNELSTTNYADKRIKYNETQWRNANIAAKRIKYNDTREKLAFINPYR